MLIDALGGNPNGINDQALLGSSPNTATISQMQGMPGPQQIDSLAQLYGVDRSQLLGLFNQPAIGQNQPFVRDATYDPLGIKAGVGQGGDLQHTITPGNGPSGIAMDFDTAVRNGGINRGGNGIYPNTPGNGPDQNYMGYPNTGYNGRAANVSDLAPPFTLPAWLMGKIPQMLAAKSRGEYDPSHWYDIYAGGYIVPPMRQPDLTNMWISARRAPASAGDTNGGVGPFNLDRFGRLDTPYIAA